MLEEFKFFYKNLSLYRRLLLCSLTAMIVPLYVYFNRVDDVESQYETAVNENLIASQKLEDAKTRSFKLPTLVAELESTREQLKLLESALPDTVKIDEVLRTVGKTVKPAAVQVLLFKPEAQIVRGDVYKYAEIPVKISVEAHEYSQICEWLDSVAGESKPMYLNSWRISPAAKATLGKPGEDGQNTVPQAKVLDTNAQSAQLSRDNLKLKFEGEFSMFKLATDAEVAEDAAKKDGGKAKTVPAKVSKSSSEAIKKSDVSAGKPSQPLEKRRQ